MAAEFRSPAEFREVMDRIFGMMDADPDMGAAAPRNRYFQGRENVPLAIARRRIRTGGDVKAALALIPVTKPVYERYRALVASEYPHLRV